MAFISSRILNETIESEPLLRVAPPLLFFFTAAIQRPVSFS
jgi:hypothetical protein